MRAREIDLDGHKICPSCVNGVLRQSLDDPDRVVYECGACDATFTPAQLYRILTEQQKTLVQDRHREIRNRVVFFVLACLVAIIIINVYFFAL